MAQGRTHGMSWDTFAENQVLDTQAVPGTTWVDSGRALRLSFLSGSLLSSEVMSVLC